ncbi:MAG TPA: YlxR family protein [Streptosporangiaceae bacterium]|nr:YlxR family protein [Streptosporangiaceae bacterium]
MARRSLPAPRSGPPVRTCVGCRARAAKSDLLRVVGRGDEVIPDPQARLPGRGAYVHPSQTCFEQAQRRRGFSRALRLPGPAMTAMLGQHLAQLCGESRSGPSAAASHGGYGNGITAGKAGSDCDERPMRTRR